MLRSDTKLLSDETTLSAKEILNLAKNQEISSETASLAVEHIVDVAYQIRPTEEETDHLV